MKNDDSSIYYNDYFTKRADSNDKELRLYNDNHKHSRISLRGNLDSISKVGKDIISSYSSSSRNGVLNAKSYSSSRASELKVKQYEDEWALIMKANLDKKNELEKE